MKILKFLTKPLIVILVFVSAIWLIGFLNRPSVPSSSLPVGRQGSTLIPPKTSFTLSPNQGQFKTGQEFEVAIILKTDQEINGADALLTFDSQALEIIEIRPGPVFPLYPRKDINLEKGQVVITGVKTSKDSQVFTQPMTFATIVLKGKIAGQTTLDFVFTKGETSGSTIIESQNSTNILEKVYNGSYTIK